MSGVLSYLCAYILYISPPSARIHRIQTLSAFNHMASFFLPIATDKMSEQNRKKYTVRY